MEKIGKLLTKEVEISTKKNLSYDYQYYGLEAAIMLSLTPRGKAAIMQYLKKKGGGHFLLKKVIPYLLASQKFLAMEEKDKLRYIFGCMKRQP